MNIVFVGGGTAGHINPALALADYVRKKEPNSNILYVGAKGGMEERLVAQSGIKFEGITVSGFYRKLNLESLKKNIKTIKNIVVSSFQSKKILKNFKPDICVGTGGYVCGTFLRESSFMKIPFIIHDSNSYPGITTKLLSKKATKVLIVNEEARKHLPKNIQALVTGTPVREKIFNFDKNQARINLGINNDLPVILSFGGSLGAKTINDVMSKVMVSQKDKYNFIHSFGKKGHYLVDTLSKQGVDLNSNSKYIVRQYIDNMPECLAAADIVICRSGATTLSEIQASCKPSILIPSPNVAENHQYYNALALTNANAASMIEEKNLNEKTLIQEIENILDKSNKIYSQYSQNLQKIAIPDATEKIYQIIMDIVNKSKER